MATYSKKTCHKCGIRLSQPDMIAKTIQVETGNSRKTLSGSELFFAVLGNEKAKKAVWRTFTSQNKRRYLRNKDVWECYKCAGVETPEEKRIRIENEKIAKENELKERSIRLAQQQAARQKQIAERAIRIESDLARKHELGLQRSLKNKLARDKRASEGSFGRFLIAFMPQFLLSFIIIYIPISEFYLRRFGLSGVKFLLFYVSVFVVAGVSGKENMALIFTVPLLMGVIDVISGFLFFKTKIRTECIPGEVCQVSSPSPHPPLLPYPPAEQTNLKRSGDEGFIEDI